MARRKPPPTGHDFRHELIDPAEDHGIWPNGRRVQSDELEVLHIALGSAHSAGDQEKAISLAEPYGFSRAAVLRAWRGF